LWIAAALARLDVDYPDNAEIVRKALPGSLEQAKWLHDEETVNAVAAFIKDGGNTAESTIRTLEIIGTKNAFEALTTQINTETITDIRHLQMLCAAASRMASKLNLDSAQYYAGITTVINRVYDGFEVGQQQAVTFPPATSDNYSIIKRNAPLARKLWIAEATRRLDLAAKDKKEDYQSNIPEEALFVVEDIFGPELVPILQRITAESRSKVDFHGKYMMVSFYNVRSGAAKILTEKTGEPHTFIDVDGRIHPGGWNPSLEE
jgi:hypothetical protein